MQNDKNNDNARGAKTTKTKATANNMPRCLREVVAVIIS
jgi:hypothetical protein